MSTALIVDYGLGNLCSIQHKLVRAGMSVRISSNSQDLAEASRLILPGVGHFAQAMKNLRERDLIDLLNHIVLIKKIPIFGICLGFQLFAKHSEEGDCPGLGWIDAEVRRFNFAGQPKPLPVPHVGWSSIDMKRPSPFFNAIPADHRYYFTHSYHMLCADEHDVLATANYGGEFTAAIQHGNIFGVQFHPEKSHKAGFEMVLNFATGEEYEGDKVRK